MISNVFVSIKKTPDLQTYAPSSDSSPGVFVSSVNIFLLEATLPMQLMLWFI